MGTESIKFSIIIPVFNSEKYITTCLSSIVKQSYKNYEILLIDDGSTDDSVRCIKDFFKMYSNIDYSIFRQKNCGPGEARNNGITHAKGDYLIFVDGDDYIHSDLLIKLEKTLSLRCYDILAYNSYIVYQNMMHIKSEMLSNYRGEIDINKNLGVFTIFPAVWNKAFNREFVIKNNLRLCSNTSYAEDLFLTVCALARAESIYFLSDCLYYYVQRGGSIMHSKRNLDAITVSDELINYFKINNIQEKYADELEYTIISTCLLETFRSIFTTDRDWVKLKKLRTYVYEQYPNGANNLYLTESGRTQVILIYAEKWNKYLRFIKKEDILSCVKTKIRKFLKMIKVKELI